MIGYEPTMKPGDRVVSILMGEHGTVEKVSHEDILVAWDDSDYPTWIDSEHVTWDSFNECSESAR